VTYKEERPWGTFEVLYEEEGLKVKRIVVKPGNRLSLQSHRQRAENWLILQGNALVVLDHKHIYLSPHQVVHIPQNARHRVQNKGAEDLVFIEVQQGSYLGEDDIVRYEDDFNRV
jgi:mannose-6-phosphate isomerase-like protein (cupin superfamily)